MVTVFLPDTVGKTAQGKSVIRYLECIARDVNVELPPDRKVDMVNIYRGLRTLVDADETRQHVIRTVEDILGLSEAGITLEQINRLDKEDRPTYQIYSGEALIIEFSQKTLKSLQSMRPQPDDLVIVEVPKTKPPTPQQNGEHPHWTAFRKLPARKQAMLVPRKTTMDYKIDSLMHKTPQTGEDRAAQRQKKSGSVSKEREDEELLNRENEELLNLPHKYFLRLPPEDQPVEVHCPDGRIVWEFSENARDKLQDMQLDALFKDISSFSSLPAELQQHLARFLDIGTLKSLRLTSRQIALSIGSAPLFETLVLKFKTASAQRFSKILEDEGLKVLVERIVIDGRDGSWHEGDPTKSGYQRTPWDLAIPKISQFPKVRNVEFWFDHEVEADEWLAAGDLKQNEGYRKFYQELFYQSIANADLVEGLTVRNVQDSLIGHFGDENGFIDARKRLKRLAFIIATEETATPEWDHKQEAIQNCFDFGLIVDWLEPTQAQLTSLTIYCDYPWNPNPFCDLREVHFPNLTELALGHWPVVSDWQIYWITSHGTTLKNLSLVGCPILYAVLVRDEGFPFDLPATQSNETESSTLTLYPTRWAYIFPLFEKRLPRLVCFHFKQTEAFRAVEHFDSRFDGIARIETYLGYLCYDDGLGPSPYGADMDLEPPEGSDFDGFVFQDGDNLMEFCPPDEAQDELDAKALEQLLKTISINNIKARQAN